MERSWRLRERRWSFKRRSGDRRSRGAIAGCEEEQGDAEERAEGAEPVTDTLVVFAGDFEANLLVARRDLQLDEAGREGDANRHGNAGE